MNQTDSGGECGVPYMMRFFMPTSTAFTKSTTATATATTTTTTFASSSSPAAATAQTSWYSFDYGNLHIVVMSTEQDFAPSSAQYAFLEVDLQQIDRSITPWVIFTGHRPMFVSCDGFVGEAACQVVAKDLQQQIEPLLFQYKVDLAMWGHFHSYQRSCPLFNQTCTAGATVHVVIGMAGASLSTNVLSDPPVWLQYVDVTTFGYSRISTNATHLVFEFVDNVDQVVKDSFVLTK